MPSRLSGIVLLAILIVVSPPIARATGTANPSSTQLFGHISADLTLQPNISYEAIGDLTVDPGVTLTILPGAQLRATPYSDYLASGSAIDRVELIVMGSLRVGGDGQQAQITSAGSHSWVGITLGSSATVDIDNSVLADASVLIDAPGGGTIDISRSILEGSSVANLRLKNAQTTLSSVQLRGGPLGVMLMGGALHASACTWSDCSDAALVINPGSIEPSVDLTASTITDCNNGIDLRSTGTFSIVGSTMRNIGGVAVNFGYGPGAHGRIQNCVIENVGVGIGARDGLVTSPADTFMVQPTTITRATIGVLVNNVDPGYFNTVVLDHLAIQECVYGIYCADYFFGSVLINYCTTRNCDYGIRSGGNRDDDAQRRYVYNSVVASVRSVFGAGLTSLGVLTHNEASYTDVWGYASSNVPTIVGNWTMGPGVSSFNPSFNGMELSNASLFTNASVSGGQIGAYGPGPVGPTPISAASVVTAAGTNGVVEIQWRTTDAAGSRTTILRRSSSGEWEALAEGHVDGFGRISIRDPDVRPGDSYGYCVGVRRSGQVLLDGEVWVRVEQPVRQLGIGRASPNPSSDSWSATVALPFQGDAELLLFDLAGRVVYRKSLADVTPGFRTERIEGRLLRAGVYTLRVDQAGHSSSVRLVKID